MKFFHPPDAPSLPSRTSRTSRDNASVQDPVQARFPRDSSPMLPSFVTGITGCYGFLERGMPPLIQLQISNSRLIFHEDANVGFSSKMLARRVIGIAGEGNSH